MINTTEKSITPEHKKSKDINNMFSKIARNYDLLNDLMTFGLHNKWKKETIRLATKETKTINSALDLCTGTGDLAIILNKQNPQIKIHSIDNCKEMLDIAKKRTEKLNAKNIEFLLTDSEELSYKSQTFDLVTIGFGLRNIINKEKCLENVFKVLKDNGIFACIDLGHPDNFLWAKLYFLYFFKFVPKLGELFARNKDAYTYLPTSLKTWYKQEELKDLILKKGFKKCYYKNFLGGILAVHIAVK